MRIRIVDAFTDRPFAGNPAGVVILDRPDFPDEQWMRRVAAEVNLSETAFAHPLPPGAEADYALRWFTPAIEVALCGHATLATAHALHADGALLPDGAQPSGGALLPDGAQPSGGALLPDDAQPSGGALLPDVAQPSSSLRSSGNAATKGIVRFATRSGVLTASAGDDGSFTLDFPTAPLRPAEAEPAVLAALGAEPLSVHHTGPQTDDLLLELPDEAAVRGLTPNLGELARFERRGVIVTAPAADPAGGYDFVSRFFSMAAGVGEDPVTGSAHTALAPYWSAKLGGRTDLVGYQASARGGLVRVSLRGARTLLTGRAVTVIDGTLLA